MSAFAPIARRGELALVGLAVLAVGALTWRYMDALGDTFWYIALGRSMLAEGQLPEREAFTFTAYGDEVMVWTPLAHVLFAALDRTLGLMGVLAVSAGAATLGLVLAWLPHARGSARWALFPFVLLLVVLQRDDLCARGQAFADACFALLLWALVWLGDGRAAALGGKHRIAFYLALFSLGAAWMNLHQSALVPLVVVPLVSLGSACDGPGARERLAAFGLAFVALVGGAFVTPYGPSLLIEAGALAANPITREIDLFQSPVFTRVDVLFVFAAATMALGLALGTGRQARRSDAVLLLALLVLAFSGRRFVPWLGFAALASLGRFASAGDGARRLEGGARPLRAAALVASVGALAFGLATAKAPYRHVPVAGVHAIDAGRLPARVFNPYHWGGYLLYAWGPTARTFVDGRLYPFDTNEVFHDAHRIAAAAPDAPRLLDTYQINTILAERGSRLDAALRRHPAWRLHFTGPIEVVHVRVRPLEVEGAPTL